MIAPLAAHRKGLLAAPNVRACAVAARICARHRADSRIR
jgi:hypothetical protein